MSLLICSEIQHPILHALAGRKEKKLAPPPPRPLPQVGEGVHTGDGQAGSRDASGCPPTFPYPSGGGISCSLSRLRERVRVRVLLPPAHLCSVPSGLLSFPRWGKAGMGAGHGPEYEQVKQQMPGWPPPSPSPSGGGISCSLSRLRERVRVRVLLPPSGLLSFPLWGKAGMGAGHGPEYEQVKQQMPGWPPPSPPQRGEGKNHPHPCPLPQVGEGVHTGDGQAGSRDALGCPSPSPNGGGISCSLSRLRERVRVRVLLPPAHLCSVPSGLLSFPRWGKAGMGAGHDPEYEQVQQQMPGWPPPSPLPSPTSGRGSACTKEKIPSPVYGRGSG